MPPVADISRGGRGSDMVSSWVEGWYISGTMGGSKKARKMLSYSPTRIPATVKTRLTDIPLEAGYPSGWGGAYWQRDIPGTSPLYT